VRSNIKGVSLIELLLVVILISTVATAYLNFRNNPRFSPGNETKLSAFDNAIYAALDEIGLELHLAYRNRAGDVVSINHLKSSDKIIIRAENGQIDYQIDDGGRLIRQIGHERRVMAEGALYFKTRKLGRETIVLTLLARPTKKETCGSDNCIRSYSRAVTVNFPLD
jgi:prepilin-type N-terminal cleavage/methylation domain-containing protein